MRKAVAVCLSVRPAEGVGRKRSAAADTGMSAGDVRVRVRGLRHTHRATAPADKKAYLMPPRRWMRNCGCTAVRYRYSCCHGDRRLRQQRQPRQMFC